MRILITGGCGFVGSTLAMFLAEAGHTVTALDNLKRRGSERNIAPLGQHGIRVVHGDVRNPEDLETVPDCDVLCECSAEASVSAGYGESPLYLLNTNLVGCMHCLEYARRRQCGIIFLSSSRVYPIAHLRSLPLRHGATRFYLSPEDGGQGWSTEGISASFPLAGSRSLYGASKLASELLLAEYHAVYNVPFIVNRCGVIAGPGQMGKVDQGFFSLWLAGHLWKGRLSYLGFGGFGLQVRDILHVYDLAELIEREIRTMTTYDGACWNVGGGKRNSVSLCELTELCREATGHIVTVNAVPETAAADIPWYISDNTEVEARTGWRPARGLPALLEDTFAWLKREEQTLKSFFGFFEG
ncbi:MAG: NAD-dependent epimerase/dehydratase family protein [Desulfovibrio sp.]|jgi:CDP-paratose 2-epimerase|nr:NAD-dependent epimerase/dehydratase family protein [Desulfovibrio sp.]